MPKFRSLAGAKNSWNAMKAALRRLRPPDRVKILTLIAEESSRELERAKKALTSYNKETRDD